MFRAFAAALLGLFIAVPALAQTPVADLMDSRLKAGELRALETDLVQRLATSPQDDEARFALGATQFLRTIEGLAQSMYRHGLEAPRELETNVPFFRLPVPRNPSPEPLDYEKLRGMFKAALDGFGKAEATLAGMGQSEVKLTLYLGTARLDLNGDGKAEEPEELWRVLDATLGGGNIPPEAASGFLINFDRGDAAWLRGYSHLLSALIEFMLAHDGKASFDASFHMFFPRAGLPNAVLDQQGRAPDPYFDPASIADAIAFIHLMHWDVKEPERLKAALTHLEAVAAMSRESWRFILAETEDSREWIPSPKQKDVVLPGAPVTQATVDGWMVFLGEYEAILKGQKLIPHWRLSKGINLRRVFLEPRPFDPILWAQGSAALPYLEDGPVTDAQTWNQIMMMFEGNFLGYAVWFN